MNCCAYCDPYFYTTVGTIENILINISIVAYVTIVFRSLHLFVRNQ